MRPGAGGKLAGEQRSPKVIKTHQVEPGGARGQILHLTWGDLFRESGGEVSRGRSSEEGRVMRLERRAEEPKNGAREGTGDRRNESDSNSGRNNYGCPTREGREAEAVQPWRAESVETDAGIREPFDGEQCTRA